MVEAYLAGGPVEICTLCMYERQKTINEGLLTFTRAMGHLEENGFMQKVSESIRDYRKGEMYLIALLLVGQLQMKRWSGWQSTKL